MTYYFQKSTYRNTNIRRRIRIALLLVLFMPIIAGIGGEKWSRRLRQFDALDGLNPPKLGGIVFTGSSSIEYWESLAEDFRSHYVLNRGVGGALIAHLTYFADRVIIPYQPRMIVLYCGENDLYIGRTADQVLADLDAFVKRVHKDLPRVIIAFISIKPALGRRGLLARVKATNEKIKAYAAEHKNIKYIDVFIAMLNENGYSRAELFERNGLHMNRSGYELWKRIIEQHLVYSEITSLLRSGRKRQAEW